MTRIFFSVGEPSGDMHGSHLIRALLELAPGVECEGFGGPRMAAAGMKLHYDLAEKAIMGFTEVLKSTPLVYKLFNEAVASFRENRPDLLVLIDYPGFNLRLAAKAHALGIPVVYYISPQIWAWKKGRLKTIARVVDKMLVILPFEKKLYDDAGVDCEFVGHPLLDHIGATPIEEVYEGDPVIGVLPGSRRQEIERILPIMLKVARGIRLRYPNARFITPCVDESRRDQIEALAGEEPLEVVVGNMYELLHSARFCMVASGTATVETALFGVPMVVLYCVSPLTYRLARRMVDLDAISLVNILAGRHIVPEYIQHEATPEAILSKALELISDGAPRDKMLLELNRVRQELGAGGASRVAAEAILPFLEKAHAHG